MYHIPKDKRSEKSADAISNGLIQCLQHKELAQITITDVWKASRVSRATFYRLFDNVLDVLSYKSDAIFAEIASELSIKPNITKDEANIQIIQCGMTHSEVIGAIISEQRTDILLSSILKQGAVFFHIFAPEPETSFSENVIHSMFLIMCQFLGIWIKNGKQQTAEELYVELKQTVQLLATSL